MRLTRFLIVSTAGLLLAAATIITAAQPAEPPMCAAQLESSWTAASEACIGRPSGYICNGGSAPQAEPAGPVSNALASVGALVELVEVQALFTPPLQPEASRVGIAWLRAPEPLLYTGLLVGQVSVRNVTPAGFTPWQSTVVETSAEPSSCGSAPASVYVLQSAAGQGAAVVVNGASLALNGTVLVRTSDGQTSFIALSGQSNLTVVGQDVRLWTGQQVDIAYPPGDFSRPSGPATPPRPFEAALIHHLPVALFDRPVILPQPGFVATQGPVNMRSAPSTDAGVIVQVQAGEVMSVLGSNPAGDWYHVRLDSGETGWMKADLLARNVGTISAVYDATPMPPQRYGELGRAGRVLAPAGANLRIGPDVGFPVVASLADGTQVNLVARSPYSPWLKVEAGGVVGWLSILTIETQAFIDALPVDYTVPPPPTPTRIPGSFGNAFPDPNAPSE